MAVRSSITHKTDIPHEPGEWMEFKELGWRVLEAARAEKSRSALLGFRDLGPEFFQQVASGTDDQKEVPEEKAEEVYDMSLLLRSSIIAWSYTVPCNEASIDDLDPETARWAFKEIINIHFPTRDELGKVTEASNVL